MKLSIIIPCKNEENNINNTITKIKRYLINYKFEILIIDDYSIDKTAKIVRLISKNNKFIKYHFNKIKGLGGAINLGSKRS